MFQIFDGRCTNHSLLILFQENSLYFNRITKTMNMKKLLFSLTIFILITHSEITVAIIGSNDIHGSAFPTTLERFDTN